MNETRFVPASHPELSTSAPPPLPLAIPGMEVAGRYIGAGTQRATGGDFYDVSRLGANDWGLALGDICGKGDGAAELATAVRQSMAEAARAVFRPSSVIRAVNEMLLDATAGDERFCSAVFGRLELDSCGAWVTLACAGHPRPVVVRRAGWIDVRGHAGSLMGLFDEADVLDDRVGLGPGDALVFCTDGVTEARNEAGEMFDDEGLPTALLACAGAGADAIASRIVEDATAFAGGALHDDVAVLVVSVPVDATDDPVRRLVGATGRGDGELPLPGYPVGDVHPDVAARPLPPREARAQLPPERSSPARARRFAAGVLHSWRLSELTGGDVELLLSEVATNAVVHALSPFTVILRWDGSRVRVEVGDGSRTLPAPRSARVDEAGGRGLHLVQTLAADWGVMSTVDGKRVWFEVADQAPDEDGR